MSRLFPFLTFGEKRDFIYIFFVWNNLINFKVLFHLLENANFCVQFFLTLFLFIDDRGYPQLSFLYYLRFHIFFFQDSVVIFLVFNRFEFSCFFNYIVYQNVSVYLSIASLEMIYSYHSEGHLCESECTKIGRNFINIQRRQLLRNVYISLKLKTKSNFMFIKYC